MVNKMTKEQVFKQYVKQDVEITVLRDEWYRIRGLVNDISSKGDEQAVAKLQYHCNLCDGSLWESVKNYCFKNIDISQSSKPVLLASTKDTELLEELNQLYKHNFIIQMGFYDDDKGRVYIRKNVCVVYLQRIMKLGFVDGVLRVYNHKQGIWKELSGELFGVILYVLFELSTINIWTSRLEKEIYEALVRTVPVLTHKDMDSLFVSVGNGVYDLKKSTLMHYDHNYLATRKSEVIYDTTATCPIFIKVINELMCNDPMLVQCIQELFGYALIPNTKAEKTTFFYGVGSNGKSLCAEILTELVGRNNTVNIPLSTFSTQFGLETIVDKSLNIANENEMSGVLNTGQLKAISSGDTINIPRKFKTSIDYKSTIKLVFLVNTLPDSSDSTHGFFRKLLIIPFNRVISEEEADRELKEKIFTSEMSGILNWALEGAKRLISNNYVFTQSVAVNKIMSKYKANQNPVESFYNDVLMFDEGASELRKDVLDMYKEYIASNGLASNGTDTPQKFWRLLENVAKVNFNRELEYKKVKGYMKLNNHKINYSNLPKQERSFKFIS